MFPCDILGIQKILFYHHMLRVRVGIKKEIMQFQGLVHIFLYSLCQIKMRFVHFEYHFLMLRVDVYHQLQRNHCVYYVVQCHAYQIR